MAPQLLLRSWPFPRGAGRIVDKFFSGLRFREKIAVVRTTDDFEITIDPNELIGRHIYLTGEFDRSIVELLCNFSEPNDTLLDIGANIGYVSACFLQNVPGSKSIAVEPQADVLKLLSANLPQARSTVYPYAISNTDGDAWFETNQANSGAGRVVAGGGIGTIRIPTRSADTMFRDIQPTHIDLVKIDAEGFEKTIISACAQHFERLQPKAIIFEDSANDALEISASLAAIGYKVFGIRKSLRSLALVDSDQPSHDYIAISRSRSIPRAALDAYDLESRL